MFRLQVQFITGVVVTVRSDNLVELQAIMRGLEIAHLEYPCIDNIRIDGEKTYTFERVTDNG